MSAGRRHPLIGLSGKKRSGKDTFADRLVTEHGYTRVALADPMRAAALALDPIVDPDLNFPTVTRLSDLVISRGWEEAKAHPEVRRTLQRLGTEMGRDLFGKGFWVKQALALVEKVDGPVVITDVRFWNEADALQTIGGKVVRIERPGLVSTDTHPSEVELDTYPFKFKVRNDRTVADLHAEADVFGIALEAVLARS